MNCIIGICIIGMGISLRHTNFQHSLAVGKPIHAIISDTLATYSGNTSQYANRPLSYSTTNIIHSPMYSVGGTFHVS